MYNLILATSFQGGIGYNNHIPWNIKNEMLYFKNITSYTKDKNKKNVVIMGRKTWESLLCKPLKNRINIIISNNYINMNNNVFVFNNIKYALDYCKSLSYIENIYVIGGESIYNKCLYSDELSKELDKIYLSLIVGNYKCDKFIDIKYILKNFSIDIDDIIFKNNFLSLIAYNKK